MLILYALVKQGPDILVGVHHVFLHVCQVWEDTRPLRAALAIQQGENVLCVASGGDNAFSLLLDRPRSVMAVDYSKAQILLCRLKQAAIKHLGYEEFTCLLGLGPREVRGDGQGGGGEEGAVRSSVEIYHQRLRDHLDEDVREYWDKDVQQDSIRGGVVHCGKYEQYFRIFAHVIRPLVHDEQTTRDMLSIRDAGAQRAFYDSVWDTWLWRAMVRLYMGDVLIGRCPPFYQRSDMNIGQHFLQRMRHCLRDMPIADNFYLEYILTGKLGGITSLPDYLQRENFATLKSRIDDVHFIQGEVIKHMEAAAMEGLHVADLSNIFDFVPEDQHDYYRRAVMEHMSPGSRICYWTFVPMTAGKLAQLNVPFSPLARIDRDKCERYNQQERAWFYQSFVLQCIQGEARVHRNGYTVKPPVAVSERKAPGDTGKAYAMNGHTEVDEDLCNGIY
jgi:S-adenosylmethionine-diacylglycerol 3-amino-3-carboxypropyl transferase